MSATSPSFQSRLAPLGLLIGFVIVAALLQFYLISNPGYFSHDELQWGSRADVAPGVALPTADWANWHAFQYRPLTFTVWLYISHWLFHTPVAFHALWVALGIGNGLLLFRLMRRIQVKPVPAVLFSLSFTLSPFAAYTHGWVATAADLLWVGFGLIMAQVLMWAGNERARRRPALGVVFVLTTLALLSKESAIVLPTLVALAWWLAGRTRLLRDAVIVSALPVAAYLALRLHVILSTPQATGAYHWSLASIPKQWLMYQLFPLAPSVLEIKNVMLISMKHVLIASAILLGLAISVFRADIRAGILLTVGGALALGPVLLLESPSDQYGYGFTAIVMAALALAWSRQGRVGRVLAGIFIVIGVWHGVNMQREIHRVGELQARFSPALSQAVSQATTFPVRLRPPQDDGWVYQRLSHEIPSYLGVPIGDRVQLVTASESADYLIEPDGGLKKIP
jgi:hypothetical protein